MSLTKLIALGIVVIVIVGALLWFLAIPSYFRSSSNSSYTSLTLREGMNNTATLEFGDTEYSFNYVMGYLHVWTFIGGSKDYIPHRGDTYRDTGIEVKVSDINADYISNYIVILVKPTIQNYTFTQFRYTKVNLTLGYPQTVNISIAGLIDGLINKTNQYTFTYYRYVDPSLSIVTSSQSKGYLVFAGETIKDLDIETRIYKIESEYMVIYVTPWY